MCSRCGGYTAEQWLACVSRLLLDKSSFSTCPSPLSFPQIPRPAGGSPQLSRRCRQVVGACIVRVRQQPLVGCRASLRDPLSVGPRGGCGGGAASTSSLAATRAGWRAPLRHRPRSSPDLHQDGRLSSPRFRSSSLACATIFLGCGTPSTSSLPSPGRVLSSCGGLCQDSSGLSSGGPGSFRELPSRGAGTLITWGEDPSSWRRVLHVAALNTVAHRRHPTCAALLFAVSACGGSPICSPGFLT